MAAILDFLRCSLMYFRHDYFHNLGKTLLLGPQIYADAKADLSAAIAEYDQALLLQILSSMLCMKAWIDIRRDNVTTEEFQSWL